VAKASKPWRGAVLGVLLLIGTGGIVAAAPGGQAGAEVAAEPAGSVLPLSPGPSTGGPAALVDGEAGTGIGPVVPGNVSEFPGATVPFGMVQFSPDTSPDRAVTTGSGYDYADSQISGFSLTHLSGTGCALYGDVPILPVTGAVPSDPDGATDPFSHADESSSAGNYSVGLGPGGAGDIGVRLTATTRTALADVTFPASTSDSGTGPGAGDDMLFKASDSANGSSASQVHIDGNDELTGAVTSGDFCGIPGSYTLYFAARFSRPFSSSGTWQGSAVGSAGECTGTSSTTCGGWVSFGAAAAGRSVLVKVGISYVSLSGAESNLSSEDPGWNFATVSRAATAEWNGLLDRVAVHGGSTVDQGLFYTELYRSLLFPSVFSDDDGRYVGFDHKVHSLPEGDVQYANFSECDIYRSEVPLLAMLVPGPTSQMVQSLLRDASQTPGGFLPRWAYADDDASQWDGDSVDPIIADAYAYGARQFDLKGAVAAMIHGAMVQEKYNGLVVERQNLAVYKARGWVPELSIDITSFPYTDGGSETLEYSLDDFSISVLARAAGENEQAAIFAKRGQNWQNLFNPATGYIAARKGDGSFPAGPAFQLASPADQAQGIAQQGFEEGNAIQYTWAVPQNLAGLFGLMGGDAAAVAKLNTFFTQLNASRFQPYDWAGNEPGEWVPYEYDYAGQPFATQRVVRQIMTQLYALSPVSEPGEDDMGALSSWYVWSALGLYPVTPGEANLALTSPLFSSVRIAEGNGHTLTISGTNAPDGYIESAKLGVGGAEPTTWRQPWVPASALSTGADLTVVLGRSPNTSWGTSSGEAPPSFDQDAAPAVPFSTPGGALGVSAGVSSTLGIGVEEESPTTKTSVAWHVADANGVTVTPSMGTLTVSGRSQATVEVSSPTPGVHPVTFDLRQGDTALPDLVVDIDTSS
jgi:predicted alpha-1,2-mannosidase